MRRRTRVGAVGGASANEVATSATAGVKVTHPTYHRMYGRRDCAVDMLESMHELALTQSIRDISLRACGGRRVTGVTVDIGALRQAVAPALVQCWGFIVAGTLLEGSRLVVNEIDAVIKCEECGATTRLTEPFMVCGCGSRRVSVLNGHEFLVRSIDVAAGKEE